MAQPIVLQSVFQSMRQDEPRERMVKYACWNLIDLIPSIDDSPIAKRGGWAYGSDSIAAVKATASRVQAGAYATFSAGAKNCAIDEDGELYTIASNKAVTDVGAVVAPVQNPVLHAEKLIIPASDGTTAPKYYDGAATVGALAGSPPAGKYAAVYKDRTLLAGASAGRTNVYFSAAADPTSWDTTNTYLSMLSPVTGLAALPNAVLVFQNTSTSRIRGTTPPPGSDMIVDDPIFNVGCTDARSISVNGSYCIFANSQGIYLSTGTAFPEDLTQTIGLKNYWASILSGYAMSTWTIAAGFIRNHYIVTVLNASGAFVDCLMIDVNQRRGWRLSNVDATSFWTAVTTSEELYFGRRSEAYVGALSGIFSPSSSVKNDGDGTAVTYTMESPFYTDGFWSKRARRAYLAHDMRDAATDNPTVALSYIVNPEDSYTTLATFNETTNYKVDRAMLAKTGFGFGFKLAQTHASSDTRIYALGLEAAAREKSRLN